MAVATAFTPVMTQLTGNTGGALQALPNVTLNGARQRTAIGVLTLASQASGTTIGMCRIPVSPGGTMLIGLRLITDTSLGSTTISLGNSNSAALYMAAQTFTSTNTPTAVGKTSAFSAAITSGYDCLSGLASTVYEDIVLVTSTATAPSSGTLVLQVEYAID